MGKSTALVLRLRRQNAACNADRLEQAARIKRLDQELRDTISSYKQLLELGTGVSSDLDAARTLLAQWLTRYDQTAAAQLAAKTREALAPPTDIEAPR